MIARVAGALFLLPLLAAAEVRERVASAEDARAACAGEPERVYTARWGSRAFALLPHDAARARLAVDETRALRGDDGGFEVVLHHLAGGRRPDGALELAFPASAAEAAETTRAHLLGELELTLWFRIAAPADGSAACAPVASTRGDGLRLAVEPLAFEITRRGERLASGESPKLAPPEPPPVVAPRVKVAPPVRTAENARAPAAAARVARGLSPGLLACYRRGLAVEPALRGALVAGLEIDAGGHVTSARAELDGLGVPEVTGCVLRLVRAARFPRGPERISIPMQFDG
jgi:hypothetical protein